jgi:transglutaminase superfamily protein
MRRVDLPTLRAAWWAQGALRRARRTLRRHGIAEATVDDPPKLRAEAGRGVLAVLRRTPATCLERALVLQRWHAAQGNERDVIIAVKGSTDDFAAHAWLEGEADVEAGAFEELLRLPAR